MTMRNSDTWSCNTVKYMLPILSILLLFHFTSMAQRINFLKDQLVMVIPVSLPALQMTIRIVGACGNSLDPRKSVGNMSLFAHGKE